MAKYLVIPGHIPSKNDGQMHYVGYSTLVRLYRVDPDECTDCAPLLLPDGGQYIPAKPLIELRPRYDGNYTLPTDVLNGVTA